MLILWLACGVIAAMIGARKGEALMAFIAGAIFGPFGIIFALLSKGNRMNCPFCKELMHKEATVCPHCQRELAPKIADNKSGAPGVATFDPDSGRRIG